MGVDIAEVQTVFTTCLRLIDPLLVELKIAPDDYWGSYVPLHDRLIEERVQAARIRLEGKVAKARAIFEQRSGDCPRCVHWPRRSCTGCPVPRGRDASVAPFVETA